MRPTGDKGFTLIELMIVVIIVGVLAMVAIPMYQLVPERARATEAESGLGAVRSALRCYYAERGSYVNAAFTDGAQVTAGGVLSVTDDDLLGRYFSTECYTFNGAPTANTFSVECDGDNSTAPMATEAGGITRYIDQAGSITK